MPTGHGSTLADTTAALAGLQMAPLATARLFAMVPLAEPSPAAVDATERLQRPLLVSVIAVAAPPLVSMQGLHRGQAFAFRLWLLEVRMLQPPAQMAAAAAPFVAKRGSRYKLGGVKRYSSKVGRAATREGADRST